MDTLALLVILIGVVVITWITVSYMEIEKLKTTVNGYKTENEVIQTVGEDNTPSAAMAEVWRNIVIPFEALSVALGNVGNEIVKIFSGKIPKLEEDKIYYLAHPCTTGGKSIEENKVREDLLYKRIIDENPGVNIIRPLRIIPEDMEHEEAMCRCFKMLDAADAIILPLGWDKSRGCTQENGRAEEKDIVRILLMTN